MLHTLTLFLQAQNPDDEEFNMFLFTLLILGIIFICICVFLVVVVTLLALLAIFGFIAVGSLSASVLVGIHKKSITSGFRTFTLLFSTFAFALIGCVSFWVYNQITHWWSTMKSVAIGLCVGTLTGLITGIVFAYLIKQFSAYLKQRLDYRSRFSQ